MATTAREGGASGGRAPISFSNPLSKKPLASSATTKPSDKKPINTTRSSAKPVPNYLKPTFSSRLNPTTTTRTTPRRPTAAAATKPSFDRSRSLDTSSSSSSKSSKPTSSTSSKPSIKPAGPQRSFSTLSSRSAEPAVATPSIRRSLSTRVPPVAGLRKPAKKSGPKSVTSDSSSLEIEARDQDPLDSMISSQDDQDEVLSLPEISEMPGQDEQLGDPVMIEEEDHLVPTDEKIVEQGIIAEEKIDGEQNEESSSSSGVEESGVVVEEEEESTNVEEKHVVVEKEDDAQVFKDQDESPAKEDISTTQSGNKKEAQDYNEVIEETASKLMQNKRNKVRALAGAFETVISLQDPK